MINTLEINETLTEFGICLKTLYIALSDEDQSNVASWLYSVKRLNPSVILRPDSILKIINTVFSHEVIRDFVLDLGFRFFTTVAYGQNYDQLIECLLNGLMLDGPDPTKCYIPEQIKQSMATTLYQNSSIIEWCKCNLNKIGFHFDSPIKTLLRNNKVVILVILINLTYTFQSET